ncbi:MAG: effector-binding domain-containing protein [Planctomycetota bacterium]|jgi:effector-binding domain-containing protein
MLRTLTAISLSLCFTACVITPGPSASTGVEPGSSKVSKRNDPLGGFVPDLPISESPFDQVHVSWKQRLDQPYVFMERRGDYTETGAFIATVHREMIAQGLEPDGPPFALYFDDPGKVETSQLRSRICMPVAGQRSPAEPLGYDVLPSVTVVYAFVSGPYPDVARSYPGLYAFMDRMDWTENGPLRETYLVPPSAVDDFSQLVTEVQIPVALE